MRPSVIKEYRIAAEGAAVLPGSRGRRAVDASAPTRASRPVCARSGLPEGLKARHHNNHAGAAAADRTQPRSTCTSTLTRQHPDRRPVAPRPRCHRQATSRLRDPHRHASALAADLGDGLAGPFYDSEDPAYPQRRAPLHGAGSRRSGAVSTTLSSRSTSLIRSKTGTVSSAGQEQGGSTIGFYSPIGSKGRTRTVHVTFVDEAGAKSTGYYDGNVRSQRSRHSVDSSPSRGGHGPPLLPSAEVRRGAWATPRARPPRLASSTGAAIATVTNVAASSSCQSSRRLAIIQAASGRNSAISSGTA